MLNVSASPFGSLAVGVNEYCEPCIAWEGGAPEIVGAWLPAGGGLPPGGGVVAAASSSPPPPHAASAAVKQIPAPINLLLRHMSRRPARPCRKLLITPISLNRT